jgi:hypothetical protein
MLIGIEEMSKVYESSYCRRRVSRLVTLSLIFYMNVHGGYRLEGI